MRLPNQLPPIVRSVSPVREASVTRPAQSLKNLTGGGHGTHCSIWVRIG